MSHSESYVLEERIIGQCQFSSQERGQWTLELEAPASSLHLAVSGRGITGVNLARGQGVELNPTVQVSRYIEYCRLNKLDSTLTGTKQQELQWN